MKFHSVLVMAVLCCSAGALHAQEKCPVKFGRIAPDDFIITQAYDSGASAVVIADVGSSAFEGNAKGWFSLVYKRTTRIKICNKNGFDAAKVEIPVFSDGSVEEKLDDIKAYTYNLENGKVVAAKLDGASIFKDQLDKNNALKKFTLPAVKEGSIIEYSYTIKSDFLQNLRHWFFQAEYPCLWSEYEVGIPEFFNYVTLNQGFTELSRKTGSYIQMFHVSVPGGADRNEQVTLNGNVNTTRWVAKNIPALREERYTSTIKNYISGVEFQLSSYQFEGGMLHEQMGNWVLLSQKLMDNEYFGQSLSKNNGWLDDDLKSITKGCASSLEKAQKIFAYVRDNLTCTDHSAFYIGTTLRDAYKKHNGNVADINLLLIAMLHHEHIDANPIILSTKDNGFTNELYPLLQRFNYVICQAEIDGTRYNLDASSPYNGFNRLPPYCYNGHARKITKEAALPVYFESDSLKEQKITTVFLTNEDKGGMGGSFTSQLGYYESFDLRKKLKGEEKSYLQKLTPGTAFDFSVSGASIDSMKKPDMPLSIHYEFAFKPSATDNIIYLNPMMSEAYKENPFKSANRRYPVEMPYAMDETYVFNMEIPTGYMVEEMPKPIRVTFNEDDGSFEYLIQQSAERVQLRTRVRLNKATFMPDDYNGLRDFFAMIVKKQNEQIVLKKK